MRLIDADGSTISIEYVRRQLHISSEWLQGYADGLGGGNSRNQRNANGGCRACGAV